MGFDFTSDSGREFQLRSGAWSFFLYLAEGYGWVKRGTVPPPGLDGEEWQGDYASNDGQYVTAEDASALADAYDRALGDPRRQGRAAEIGRQLDRDVQELARRDGIELPPDDEEWSIDEGALREFVGFLRAGGFRID
jgi:hypothetical protein